ncbi:hypothetical protein BDDG_03182 [Blastomyces dermatitidis ATCC 18188]|uniref:C2H2-type domain-containing protein n=1 Tax=Ajellomyces dermatitidis (strain ATCC 18188 / CBS 674.68) TaxID=653446 RepID=F2TAH8_AJEDA|nr:hypothetical protein BDDG_03182 [Blastomyces dermatitidis ATCC 18188]
MIRRGEDDPRLSDSDPDSGYNSGCFSDAEDSQTDCSSVSGCDEDTKAGADSDISDDENSDDDGEWLQNQEEEHPPEYYLQLAASLDTSKLRQLRYSPNTQARLDWVEEHWKEHCSYVGWDVTEAYHDITIRTLYSFLSWVCDRRFGKNGRRRGIKRLSSLQTFWKWFQMVYKIGAGKSIDQEIITKSQDLLRLIAKEKGLSEEAIEKGTMYVEDLAEFCRVLLATTEMLFLVGYLRIQLILFCHFAGYTSNRPSAMLDIRLGDLELTLVRDAVFGRPRLVVKVTFDYTKRFLGKKASDTFPLPEIIYDPSLILSPHVFLLGMLFHFKAFKDPNITSPESLYRLDVLKGLNQQKLLLREDLRDKFLFCEAIRDGETVKLLQAVRLSPRKVSYRMKKGGELTGFEQTVKPYVLRNGAANKLNENPDVSDSMQNQILKHSNISTYVKHYQNRNITVNTYRNYRGLDPKADDYLNLNSMSLSIDPRRPWKLTAQESRSKLKRRRDATAPGKKRDALEDRCREAQRRLNNDKQHARVKLKREKLQRYNEEQPVIDSRRQLEGQIVDEAMKSVLERTEYMMPEMIVLIDALLTLPRDSWDAEQQRRINAINAITSYCGVQEGSLRQYRSPDVKMTQDREDAQPSVNKPPVPEEVIRLTIIKCSEAKRPTMCFLCLQNEKLKHQERIHSYHAGSITKHFERKHLKDFKKLDCKTCKVTLDTLKDLLIHAEQKHGTVTRNPRYLSL